ncbi:TIGR02530 family flagellar biosynthesis protein [Clostridium sp. YIM B02551]|uniref:TIGR02530 family flagellar biosynthesis protein n=1 Tax=Clostridium sp. YIM B02551 TaxID=2910679 RepID=UPI001EECD83C|nr:TIGR02530 family flagellar biosynthesis protein [Clostridium sp. YIM B02551]
MSYRIINGHAYPIGNFPEPKEITRSSETSNTKSSFKEILKNEIKNSTLGNKEGFTLSNHAAERLSEINFTQADYKELEKGLGKAREKGSKNTLMLYKDVAIIASVQNNTIITAVDKTRAQENVFTNIDSVVIL